MSLHCCCCCREKTEDFSHRFLQRHNVADPTSAFNLCKQWTFTATQLMGILHLCWNLCLFWQHRCSLAKCSYNQSLHVAACFHRAPTVSLKPANGKSGNRDGSFNKQVWLECLETKQEDIRDAELYGMKFNYSPTTKTTNTKANKAPKEANWEQFSQDNKQEKANSGCVLNTWKK